MNQEYYYMMEKDVLHRAARKFINEFAEQHTIGEEDAIRLWNKHDTENKLIISNPYSFRSLLNDVQHLLVHKRAIDDELFGFMWILLAQPNTQSKNKSKSKFNNNSMPDLSIVMVEELAVSQEDFMCLLVDHLLPYEPPVEMMTLDRLQLEAMKKLADITSRKDISKSISDNVKTENDETIVTSSDRIPTTDILKTGKDETKVLTTENNRRLANVFTYPNLSVLIPLLQKYSYFL